MKRLFAIIYFLIPVCLHAQVDTAAYAHPVIHVTNPHYITSWSQLGSFDTCVVKAGTNLGGGYLHGGGTASHHWVLINEGGFINMNGIELDDVKYFDILCIGSNDEFGCIMDASHNGFALPIEGKSDSITIEGMLINGGINEGITAKIEAPDYQFKYHCNTSYATWVQNHITIKFCKFRYNGGESVYANSTGWNKRDNVTCPIGVGGSDSTYKFAVPPSDYIVVDSNIFIGPGRSAVNFSNLSHGEFIGNKGWHIGRELNIAQGRLLACGGAVIDPVVKNNKNSGSFNNAFWFASEGTIDFENNTWDSAGYYGTFKNTDETPGVVFGVTDRTVRPGAVTWKICNNTGAHANNGIEFGLYPGFQNTTTGNYFGGNTGAHVIDNSFPFVYSTNCGSSNIPPVVYAGADVSITLPTTTVNLSGTATDADGTIASHTWTNTDGCSITSASSLTTTATCSTAGDHVFTLSATDNSGATSTDDLTATVISGANTPPVAIASTDNIIFLPVDSVILNQSGTDADGTIIRYQSKLISSYFSPRFKYGNTQHPVVKGLTAGDTILISLRVQDNDSAWSNYDTTTLIILGNATNHAPHARINRDTNTSIREPIGQITVDGSNSYDTDKGDYIASYLWKQIAGDNSIILTGTNASVLTLANMSVNTYRFRLIVTDTHGAKDSLDFSIQGEMKLRFQIIRSGGRTVFNPIYGGLWANYTVAQKVQASRIFNFKENRVEVNFVSWNGTNSPVADQLVDSGQLVSLNIREAIYSDTAHFSSVNLTTYAVHVDTLTNHLKHDSVTLVQGNEGNSSAYHFISDTTDLQPNVQMLSIVTRIGHAKGFKVADGGITSGDIVYTTYRYLSDAHDPDTTNFLQYCVPPGRWTQLKNRSNPVVEFEIAKTKYLLRRYDTVPADFGNAHLYFPLVKYMDSSATNWRVDYTGITQVTKMLRFYYGNRSLMTNEFGLLLTNADLTKNVATDLKANHFVRQTYWNDPTSIKVNAITNGAVMITTLGTSYKTSIQ